MDKALFDLVVEQMTTRLDNTGSHLDMVSIIVSGQGQQFSHYFGTREKVDLRSIAKPVLCLAVGAAIRSGLSLDGVRINLDTPIWQFISRYATIQSPDQVKKWEQVRLIDLFRSTLGHDKGIMFSEDVKSQREDDLVNYVVNYPITKEVGKSFIYSNAGAFIVSTLITEYLGVSAEKFVDEFVFSKLGIQDYEWRRFGKYTAGCTGLKMQNEDLHKIGRLIHDGGTFNGVSVVPQAWVDMMRSQQVAAPTHRYIAGRAYPKWSYGLNLWICEDGIYYCDGTDSQYMIIIPRSGTVITTTGHQVDTQPVSECLGMFK